MAIDILQALPTKSKGGVYKSIPAEVYRGKC